MVRTTRDNDKKKPHVALKKRKVRTNPSNYPYMDLDELKEECERMERMVTKLTVKGGNMNKISNYEKRIVLIKNVIVQEEVELVEVMNEKESRKISSDNVRQIRVIGDMLRIIIAFLKLAEKGPFKVNLGIEMEEPELDVLTFEKGVTCDEFLEKMENLKFLEPYHGSYYEGFTIEDDTICIRWGS